ncbi:MAG: LTA synthase family protein [bacterium]|nr:LTA synthase family protein [bacterium]
MKRDLSNRRPNDAGETASVKAASSKKMPDIYYIILDGYASFSTIKSIYNYDNDAFASDLETMGFYVARESRTRYKLSQYSTGSSLNMSYMEEKDDAYGMLRNSKVVAFLKKAGYTVVNFPLGPQAVFNQSDYVYDFSERKRFTLLSDFYVSLMETTMLRPVYEWLLSRNYNSFFFREKILYAFDKLENLPRSLKGPKFVYAHIVSPHWPFVFDRDGGPVDHRFFADIDNKKYYLDQYIYITKKAKQLAEALISRSEVPPIIIFQSDHGPRGMGPRGRNYTLVVGEEWKRILNVYYFPQKEYQALYPGISPFNSFVVIFKQYFGAALPMLEE